MVGVQIDTEAQTHKNRHRNKATFTLGTLMCLTTEGFKAILHLYTIGYAVVC